MPAHLSLTRPHSNGVGSRCSRCTQPPPVGSKLLVCSACKAAWYCGRDCQVRLALMMLVLIILLVATCDRAGSITSDSQRTLVMQRASQLAFETARFRRKQIINYFLVFIVIIYCEIEYLVVFRRLRKHAIRSTSDAIRSTCRAFCSARNDVNSLAPN